MNRTSARIQNIVMRGLSPFIFASFLILITSLFAGTGAVIMAAGENMVKLMPAPSCADGFIMDAGTILYSRESLYERINGESELYLPYGFESLASARYTKKNDPESAIEVDIYLMSSLLNAFGIYTNYRRKDDQPAGMGADSFVSLPLLLFYQGRYFIRIQSAGSTDLGRDILTACGRTVSALLPAGKEGPAELIPFRVPGVIKNSERYIARSLLGYEFFPSGIIADAMAAGDKFQVFVMTVDNSDASDDIMKKYLAYLRESGKKATVTGGQGNMSLETEDPLYGDLCMEQRGRHLVGAARIKNKLSAKKIITQIGTALGK